MSNNSIDTKKISNYKFNLIRNFEEYNYQKLVKIIKENTGKNVLMKIINILHRDINQKFKNYSPKQIVKNNKEPKYNEFISNITPIHNSIIFDLFFGIKKVTKICNNCKGKLITYKLINVITISIDRIKQNFVTKDITRQKTGKETNVITSSIEECLSYYLKEEKDCDGMFKCQNCNNNEKYNKIKEICEYPDCTVFYLNNSKQENIRINFKKNIILSNNDYELIGIISQQNNEEEKKFIPYCQDIINKIWLKYEDENINKIDINKEKKDISYPIALFYQKIK
jgi:ubiquitin C-terminal hydrolase